MGRDLNQVKAVDSAKIVISILPGFGIDINISLINIDNLMIAHNQIVHSMFSVGKIKSMKGFYLESCSLFSIALDLNIILVCEIFTVFVL